MKKRCHRALRPAEPHRVERLHLRNRLPGRRRHAIGHLVEELEVDVLRRVFAPAEQAIITAYLENPEAKLEHAQQMAAHSDPKTTRLYDRRSDAVSINLKGAVAACQKQGNLLKS